ncbi:MAG: hypothetical protein M9962_01435 [Oligoflexia bacterium]|nr:hypothetical protein [Oligoflexia bacterium]
MLFQSEFKSELRFLESSFTFKDQFDRLYEFLFNRKLKIYRSAWTGQIIIKQGYQKVDLSKFKEEDQEKILRHLFSQWKNLQPEAARKAAFDYIDAQKGFVSIAVIASVVVALPLAAGLYSDSYKQFSCTNDLLNDSYLSEMNVVKSKKKRKGHYILTLENQLPSGQIITGMDQIITQDESLIPKSFPVVISRSRPECWSLTKDANSTEPNWAKRKYFAYFTAMFGSFFLVCGVFGTLWSLNRIRRKPKFKETVEAVLK